jgi:DNA adenine methylase
MPLDLTAFEDALRRLNSRDIPYLISFDGHCGTREYGRELAPDLDLVRVLLVAGRSSQATLLGRNETTVESLYVSPALRDRLAQTHAPAPTADQLVLLEGYA